MTDRLRLLEFLATNHLLEGESSYGQVLAQTRSRPGGDAGIGRPADALDVFDLEAVAQRNISLDHWGYMMSGVDGEDTLRANREAYASHQLSTRRLVDVSKLDMGVELFGTRYASPIFLCPIGDQKIFHPEAELAVARAAKAKDQLMLLSTVSATSVEEVAAARGAPVWHQLYTTSSWDVTVKLVKRAEAAGCPVLALTVDIPAGRNTETATRLARVNAEISNVSPGPNAGDIGALPMFKGIDMTGVLPTDPGLTWDVIKRLRDVTRMKILIKGLESGEDAALAVKWGADGIIVSNHGGRATETGRGALECLPDVVAAVRGRIPVLMDGGVRRGTDALKALALGATAVGIGRPYIWGLGAFGQPGVERVLDILNAELRLAMVGVGARSVSEITGASVVRKA